MKTFHLEIDGEHIQAYAAQSGGTLWVHANGEIFTVKTEKRSRRGKASGGYANPGEVVSPMPGKIIKIMAKTGDDVKAGQALLVMEAMKMEYTLKAQADGKVSSVACEAGEQVTLGQSLIRLEV